MNNNLFILRLIFLICFLLCASFLTAQSNPEEVRLNTIKYGTDTEIANLIQTLKNEGAEYLDNEIISLAQNTRNKNILGRAFSFFGERDKGGLEERAVRAVEEREDEDNETVIAAID